MTPWTATIDCNHGLEAEPLTAKTCGHRSDYRGAVRRAVSKNPAFVQQDSDESFPGFVGHLNRGRVLTSTACTANKQQRHTLIVISAAETGLSVGANVVCGCASGLDVRDSRAHEPLCT